MKKTRKISYYTSEDEKTKQINMLGALLLKNAASGNNQ